MTHFATTAVSGLGTVMNTPIFLAIFSIQDEHNLAPSQRETKNKLIDEKLALIFFYSSKNKTRKQDSTRVCNLKYPVKLIFKVKKSNKYTKCKDPLLKENLNTIIEVSRQPAQCLFITVGFQASSALPSMDRKKKEERSGATESNGERRYVPIYQAMALGVCTVGGYSERVAVAVRYTDIYLAK